MNHSVAQSTLRGPAAGTFWKLGRTDCRVLAAVAVAALVSSCASTSVKKTWRSSSYQGGPLQRVAVVADHEEANVRMMLEGRFVRQLQRTGQPAFETAANYPDLKKARTDKEATVTSLRAAGADSILITRLVSKARYMSQPRSQITSQSIELRMSTDGAGWDTSLGSYSTSSSAPRSDDRDFLLLETSLFELKTGQRVWACITETTVLETADKLEVADEFVAKVVELMHKEGLTR